MGGQVGLWLSELGQLVSFMATALINKETFIIQTEKNRYIIEENNMKYCKHTYQAELLGSSC